MMIVTIIICLMMFYAGFTVGQIHERFWGKKDV